MPVQMQEGAAVQYVLWTLRGPWTRLTDSPEKITRLLLLGSQTSTCPKVPVRHA